MNTLDIATSCGVAPKKVAGTNGGEYASACPICGGTDRFRLWPAQGEHGKWWCRGCGKGGDAIQLLRDAKGMGFKEACDYLGHTPAARTVGRTPRSPQAQGADWKARETHDPVDTWQAKAAAFVEHAHKALLSNKDQLSILAERGIREETVRRFRLGWNPKDLWRARKTWGLEEGKKLYFPAGLVIPHIVDAEVLRIRFRRAELKRPGDARYIVLAGSNMAAMVIPPVPSPRGERAQVVVESELDALLIAQDAGDLVGVVSLGNSTARPDRAAREVLDRAACILVALDSDPAGAKAWTWWTTHFTQADRWPVPRGKDPGEYHKAGGNIREWILAGLPPGLKPQPARLTEEAPGPCPGQAPATQSPDDELTPYVKRADKCPSCGKRLTIYEPAERPAGPVSCFACLPEPEPPPKPQLRQPALIQGP